MFSSAAGEYKVFTLIFFNLFKSSQLVFRDDVMFNFFQSLSRLLNIC